MLLTDLKGKINSLNSGLITLNSYSLRDSKFGYGICLPTGDHIIGVNYDENGLVSKLKPRSIVTDKQLTSVLCAFK
jgi:hypothetical protein